MLRTQHQKRHCIISMAEYVKLGMMPFNAEERPVGRKLESRKVILSFKGIKTKKKRTHKTPFLLYAVYLFYEVIQINDKIKKEKKTM